MSDTFDIWKMKVDSAIRKLTLEMLDADSLPDWDYYSAYESGVSPMQAAKAVIRNAKEY